VGNAIIELLFDYTYNGVSAESKSFTLYLTSLPVLTISNAVASVTRTVGEAVNVTLASLCGM
jgi:hypothetical protein